MLMPIKTTWKAFLCQYFGKYLYTHWNLLACIACTFSFKKKDHIPSCPFCSAFHFYSSLFLLKNAYILALHVLCYFPMKYREPFGWTLRMETIFNLYHISEPTCIFKVRTYFFILLSVFFSFLSIYEAQKNRKFQCTYTSPNKRE